MTQKVEFTLIPGTEAGKLENILAHFTWITGRQPTDAERAELEQKMLDEKK